MRLKMNCWTETKGGDGNRTYVLHAVADKEGTNATWSKWTPSGKLEFTVTNPEAHSLVPGKAYYVDLVMVDE